MPDQSGTGHIWGEVILVLVGLILRQGLGFLLDIRFADLHQKGWEEAITRADDIETQNSSPSECPQGFIGDGGMVLVNI